MYQSLLIDLVYQSLHIDLVYQSLLIDLVYQSLLIDLVYQSLLWNLYSIWDLRLHTLFFQEFQDVTLNLGELDLTSDDFLLEEVDGKYYCWGKNNKLIGQWFLIICLFLEILLELVKQCKL